MYTRTQIDMLLSRSVAAVERAMVVLYERQTEDEQHSRTAKYQNGVGFSGAHAKRGTYYAKWVMGGRSLSGRHLINARRIALRHSKQLVEAANHKLSREREKNEREAS